jgi:4-aminobutyrate aminotransferase-like enzyme
MVAKEGQGMVVTDVDGNQFLDFSAGIAVCATGHCHPQVVKAIQEQTAKLIHMSGTDFYYPQMSTLAHRGNRPGDADEGVLETPNRGHRAAVVSPLFHGSK